MNYKFTLLLLLLPFLVRAQPGTTLEEYRYLTKGFAYQIEMGLDTEKDGYTIRSLYMAKNRVEFIGLFQTEDNQLKGITAILNPRTMQPTFFCLPHPATDPTVMAYYQQDKKTMDPTLQEQLDMARREWQFVQLGAEAGGDGFLSKISDPVDGEEFAARGIENIPEEYNIPAVDPSTLPPRPLAEKKMVPASVVLSDELGTRSFVRAPILEDRYFGSGKVAVKVCVDEKGRVHYARYTMKGSTSLDENLKEIAIASARASLFAQAEEREQCGIITFEFE